MRLPDPGVQSMTSDWQIAATGLGKLSCLQCGLAFRDPALPRATDFQSGYRLYGHPPGGIAERARQSAYAAWIAASVPAAARVLDVGCGNGSLLMALGERWPSAELMGCDPSPASVQYARAAGVHAWTGTAADLPLDRPHDLAVSVNVIEHTDDPHAFFGALGRTVAPGGRMAVICPDGATPGVELLIADHRFSFTATHLEAMLRTSGFTMTRWSTAPRELGPFQLAIASRQGAGQDHPVDDPEALLVRRESYLRAWRQLDASLTARLPFEVVCFGAGEAAGLLRAYTPATWARVRVCATDHETAGTFGDRPHVSLTDVPKDVTILVAVRPQDQRVVADRLRPQFAHVVTWYDLVPSGDAG